MKENTGFFLLDLMLQYVPLGIVIIDFKGYIESANSLAKKILKTADNAVWEGKKSIFDIDEVSRTKLKEKIEESLDKGIPLEFEFILEIDGKKVLCGIYNIDEIIEGPTGKYICFLDDASSRKSFKEKGQRIKKVVHLLLNSVKDAILVADYDTKRISFANLPAIEMLGYGKSEIINKPIAELHPEDDLERIYYILDRQARGEISLAEDIPFLKKNGDVIYVDINSVSVKASNRKYILGVLRDITYKKALLSKLLTTNRLLEAIFEKTTLMFAHMNEDFRIIRVNENFARALGPDVEQFVGRNFFDIFKEPELKALFEEVVLFKKSVAMREFPFTTPAGKTVYVDFKVSSLKEDGSDLEGVVFSGIDVTELVTTRRALREIEYIKNVVLQELNELVVYISPQYDIKWANTQYLASSIYDSFEELVGKKCFMSLESRDKPCDGCPVSKAIEEKKSHSSYVKFTNGREFYVRAFPDLRGEKLEGVVVACLDVTELRERERKIKGLNNMLTVMKEVNRVVMRGETVEEIAKDVVEVLVKRKEYRFAAVLLTDRLNIPVYHASAPGEFESEVLDLVSAMSRGFTPQCIERVMYENIITEKTPAGKCEDCSLQKVCVEGYALLAKRLEYKGNVMGVLIVCTREKNIEDREEVELFSELADDIAYAIYHLNLN